jgi:hypothetical protein
MWYSLRTVQNFYTRCVCTYERSSIYQHFFTSYKNVLFYLKKIIISLSRFLRNLVLLRNVLKNCQKTTINNHFFSFSLFMSSRAFSLQISGTRGDGWSNVTSSFYQKFYRQRWSSLVSRWCWVPTTMEVYMEEKSWGRGNSLLLACSILCRSLLNLVDIKNCNSNFFWSKHENDAISKLWKGWKNWVLKAMKRQMCIWCVS